MTTSTALLWLRRDLRLADNPALNTALAQCNKVIPVYIDDPAHQAGAASRWWLHHSLKALSDSLHALGSRLIIRRGESLQCLRELAKECQASHLFWNRLYEPDAIARDQTIKCELADQGLSVESFNGALLYEPWQVLKSDASPYRVFTPFWKAVQRHGLLFGLQPAPEKMPAVSKSVTSIPLEVLGLLPEIGWDTSFYQYWQPGENGARALLHRFLDTAVQDYAQARDIPGRPGTSRLSPHLHFGELSPSQISAAVATHQQQETTAGIVSNSESFIRELAWREFAHYLLFHFPKTTEHPFDERFERFQWNRPDKAKMEAWQTGQTGIPIVDAGMRELWHTGWMHNRVRMIVASLLTKNLLIHWQFGARWFDDTLLDADLAANTLGWQWTAGCGADAAPFFRIFNPVLQGQKFDRQGSYVRRWVPEIATLPDKYIHRPWEAPSATLKQAGIVLGAHYPQPIVDLKLSRQQALERFAQIKRKP